MNLRPKQGTRRLSLEAAGRNRWLILWLVLCLSLCGWPGGLVLAEETPSAVEMPPQTEVEPAALIIGNPATDEAPGMELPQGNWSTSLHEVLDLSTVTLSEDHKPVANSRPAINAGLQEEEPSDLDVAGQSRELVAWQNEQLESISASTLAGQSTSFTPLTITQLRAKFPNGKYWNHAYRPGMDNALNNADGWTDMPCPDHTLVNNHIFASDTITCNGYLSNGVQCAFQCAGFALKLAYDSTGTDPLTWTKITDANTAVNNIKPGDVVRINNDTHSIFVTYVENDVIAYADCNNTNAPCIICWNHQTTRSELKKHFTFLLQSPSSVSWGDSDPCVCRTNNSGIYTTQRSAYLYAAHNTGSTRLATIPSGTAVQVTRGGSAWAHVSYNGQNGYIPMSDLSQTGSGYGLAAGYNDGTLASGRYYILNETSGKILSVPNNTAFDFTYFPEGLSALPSGHHIGIWTDPNEDFSNVLQVEFLNWDNANMNIRVHAVGIGTATLRAHLCDENTNEILAGCEFTVIVTQEKATLTNQSSSNVLEFSMPCDSKQITLTAGGYIPQSFSFEILSATGSGYQLSWPGNWSGWSHDLLIQPVSAGGGKVVIAVMCGDKAYASIELQIYVYQNSEGGISLLSPSLGVSQVVLSNSNRTSATFEIVCGMDLPSDYSYFISTGMTGLNGVTISNAESSWRGIKQLVSTITLSKSASQMSGSGEFSLTYSIYDNSSTYIGGSRISVPVYVTNNSSWLLSYNIGRAVKAPSDCYFSSDYPAVIPWSMPYYPHYTCTGWSAASGSDVPEYTPGNTVSANRNLTLYATWAPNLPAAMLTLPANLTEIEQEAFADCAVQTVIIPQSCTKINALAFANCSSLYAVVIPGRTTQIASNAFQNCPSSMMIFGTENSYAKTFADQHNIPFVTHP